MAKVIAVLLSKHLCILVLVFICADVYILR